MKTHSKKQVSDIPIIFSGSSPRSKPDVFLSSVFPFLAPFKSGVAAADFLFLSLSDLGPLPPELSH